MSRHRSLGIFTVFLVASAATSCSRGLNIQKGPSRGTAIIGANDLSEVSDSRSKLLVGSVKSTDTACTAFVSGPHQITTASHCLPSVTKEQFQDLTFTNADGTSWDVKSAATVDTKKDHLVLDLEETFEQFLEFDALSPGPLELIGFDSNKAKLVKHTDCAFEERVEGSGVFTHSCDTVASMSGSPLIQGGKVVGIHLGYQDKVDRNVAFETRLLGDDTVDVIKVGIANEFGRHFRGPHIRNVLPHIRVPSLGDIKGGIVRGAANTLAAPSQGWTKDSCTGIWRAVVLGAIAAQSESLCGGASAGVCAASGGAVAIGGGLVEAVCTQLCTDHRLQGCR